MVNNRDIKVSYRGNGVTTVFPFSFPFIKKEYIHVAIYDSLTNETTDLKKDYYVDSVAKTVVYPGWEPGQEPAESSRPPVLPETSYLTIYRQTDIDQLTDLGEKYPLPMIEDMADKLTEILQEQEEGLSRCIKAQIGSADSPEEMYQKMAADAAQCAENAAQTSADAARAKTERMAAEDARDAAAESAAYASDCATAASRSAETAADAASTATSQAANVGVLATAAENVMAGYAAYSVPAWDPTVIYSYPTVVSYIDGNTYRCIGTDVAAGTTPDSSQEWIRITTRGGDDFFEIDVWGALMPAEDPTVAAAWTLDNNGDIMPKDASDNIGREETTVSERALARANEIMDALPMELDDDGNATTTAADEQEGT